MFDLLVVVLPLTAAGALTALAFVLLRAWARDVREYDDDQGRDFRSWSAEEVDRVWR